MCYMIITSRSLLWFISSISAAMLIFSAIVTPKWLIGPQVIKLDSNFTTYRNPSVGIYTRCILMDRNVYHCGAFDLNGFATDSTIYPTEWKAAMFFISLGFAILSGTVFLTLLTCFRQSLFGKSIHTTTGTVQVLAGISIMFSLFLHPLGWGSKRVIKLCGSESEPFYPAECSLGWAFYCAIAGVLLCFVCAITSLLAESANLSTRVKRRVEEGDRLVCVP